MSQTQFEPLTGALALAQQTLLDEAAEAAAGGAAIGGWKLGLTSGDRRDAFGVGLRPVGYLPAAQILRSGSTLWWDDQVQQGAIENELCFELAESITEPVTAEDMVETLRGVAPAFEINQHRLGEGVSNAERLADNLSHWGVVVGECVPIPADWAQTELKVRLLHNADGVDSVAADGHIDDHFVSLARLSNQLLDYGHQLEAGQRVITGSFARAAEPKRGLWSGDFGAFGRVHVRIER